MLTKGGNFISSKNTQLTRYYGETRGEIENRILARNPNWNKETVYNWSDNQLLAVYKKEEQKLVKEILSI